MSWNEGQDPIAGDAHSCDALELVIVPRVRDLGGFSVRRALPLDAVLGGAQIAEAFRAAVPASVWGRVAEHRSAFLAAHPDFSADDLGSSVPVWKHPTMPQFLQTLPHRDRTDGFFIARLSRG